jgi:hypothetical protein
MRAFAVAITFITPPKHPNSPKSKYNLLLGIYEIL